MKRTERWDDFSYTFPPAVIESRLEEKANQPPTPEESNRLVAATLGRGVGFSDHFIRRRGAGGIFLCAFAKNCQFALRASLIKKFSFRLEQIIDWLRLRYGREIHVSRQWTWLACKKFGGAYGGALFPSIAFGP